MEEEILKELKTKYAKLGLSDTILKVQATKIARTVKEDGDIANAVELVGDDLKIFQSLSDQIRTQQKEIDNLKKAESKKQDAGGKKQDDTNQPQKTPSNEGDKQAEMPQWAKLIIENQKTLSDGLTALSEDKKRESQAQKLTQQLQSLGVNENFYTPIIEGKTFQSDEEIEAFAQSLKEKENAYLQSLNAQNLNKVTPPVFTKQPVEGQPSEGVLSFINQKLKPNESN